MRRQVTSSTVVPVVVLLVVAGCTSGTEPAPTTPAERTASASPTPEGPDGVERRVELAGAEMTVEVGPVRVDGDRGVIPLEVSVAADAPADFEYSPGSNFSTTSGPGVGLVRAVDLAAGVVLPPGLDEEGIAAGSREGEPLGAGESIGLEVVIPAPSGDRVDVLVPHFGLVRDVPVVEGQVPDTSDLDLEGEITFATPAIETFVQAYDDNSSVRAEGESATVTLGSDVLFAIDEFTLTDQAGQVVDQAAAQILASGAGGEVQVVGHTDDQGSDAYNLELSRKRAASVADRLRAAVGAQFTLTVDGKGESEPVAEGTSEDARAANRRVEIRFEVTSRQDLLSAGQAPTPEPDGPVASGDGAAEFEISGAVSTARMLSVRRIDGYLVGEMEITRTAGGGGAVATLLTGEDRLHVKRGYSVSVALASAVGVALLGPSGRVYPAEYLVPGQTTRRSMLGDVNLMPTLDDGETMLVTVVWPDIGGDTVVVDVPGRFRITDVPVEG